MGREAICTATYNGETSEGKAHLDTDALIFRGGFRLSVPYKEVECAQAMDGKLSLRFRGQSALLELGSEAAPWAERILNPPSLMKKLGVKPGLTAAIMGPIESEFVRDIEREGVGVLVDSAPVDLVFLQSDEPAELVRTQEAARRISPEGAVWVITPRGRPELRDIEVMAAGKAVGLVDVKVCRFSDTHTALKFVIPKADRHKSRE